ncbi:TPA: EexN family lipoprotein [Pseudomonas aeruginosa]|uniref:EexN family lipoprotein n=1 Tax=Pseudomonas aeruginosa group TaxID=136841 RepID=UPI00053D0E07|nr:MULTISPECIES: EexN family lipoprotein [Pseudomonas aeruginosa group]EKW1630270.1 EexN family lipoprotein [Pseudomonas aeruginosa]KSC39646.1 hypothetical protein AO882_24570 [Pseudomonas paraeruginosa]MCD2846554.1 EexN family lipoprotein [Pseudomonas aeruginosa]MCG0483773.1 EexN family lipoprotein [Pseudomonas aeruginosa]MCM8577022.1 EexN family lipoprotein [Pseudomonas aeruginosa]
MKNFLWLLPLFAVLTACGDSKTKEWYMQHDKERILRVTECRNDAKEQLTADCQNALSAEAEKKTFGMPGEEYSAPKLTQ